jgi:hypothetical protein
MIDGLFDYLSVHQSILDRSQDGRVGVIHCDDESVVADRRSLSTVKLAKSELNEAIWRELDAAAVELA